MNQICKVLEKLEFVREIEQIYAFLLDENGDLYTKEIQNRSSAPQGKASIDLLTMMELSDNKNLLAIAHTHPEGGEKPSEEDKKFSDAWQIPIIAICAKTKRYEAFFPCEFTAERFPIEGRKRIVEFLDCYSLIRDYYFIKFGVSLRRMGQRIGWAIDELGEECLEKIEDFGAIKENDILVFGKNGQFLHCAIYMSDDKILHQTNGNKSCIEPFSPQLKERFVALYRLK